ncbi:MAG: thymidine phosphorylase [Kiritimatiellae bacterium]|nr:thymidine phosphorylase [Kiritimatiellia bacterium]
MIIKEVIDKKREGHSLDSAEIRDFIKGFTKGEILDAQMSALAMAICCKGMSTRETADLTDSMMRSGVMLDWGEGLPTADKHSTGGIGDKLSLIIQPLAASCGLRVPSLTGRGLGITGGTADKLETIPGYNASLNLEEMKAVVEKTSLAMTVQTAEICPADKKLYALRDVTGTVASVPLITASILSKKFAEGAETLVFDVKCGKGAFMKTREEARELARSLVDSSKASKRKSVALITDMDNPLGLKVGNANEVEEALEMLDPNCREKQLRLKEEIDLSVELASRMVALAKGLSLEAARELARTKLAEGAALEKFTQMVAAQGGDLEAFKTMREKAKVRRFRISAMRSGFVEAIDSARVGLVSLGLGAGREKSGDVIDIHAGIDFEVKVGDRVSVGAPLATLVTSTRPEALEANAAMLLKSIAIGHNRKESTSLILETIE